MKVNICTPIQTEFSYYKTQVGMQWGKHTNIPVNDINNFHYFKFFTQDQSAKIFPIWYTADTKHFAKTDDQMVIEFIEQNKDKFLSRELIPVFIDPLEGNVTIAERIDAIVEYFNHSIKMYFINADFRLQSRSNKFTHIFNDQWIHHIPPKKKPIKYVEDKIYINCNRVARYHRCMLMDQIIKNDVKDLGFNTWANTYQAFDQFKRDFPDTEIDKTKFDILDVEDITATNPTHMIPIRHCMSSFFYLNTETHYKNENLFLSEKTYKPISIGMPFISLGNPGTLELLRLQGFETFSEWMDESYDKDLPLFERVKVVVENIKMLKAVKNKHNLRKEMMPVISHNLEVYKRLQRRNTFISNLKRIEKGQI